jgi:hypothetical protein
LLRDVSECTFYIAILKKALQRSAYYLFSFLVFLIRYPATPSEIVRHMSIYYVIIKFLIVFLFEKTTQLYNISRRKFQPFPGGNAFALTEEIKQTKAF